MSALKAAGPSLKASVASLYRSFLREARRKDPSGARGTVDELRALMAAYETAGVTHIIVDAASGDVGHVRALWDRFRTDVVAG